MKKILQILALVGATLFAYNAAQGQTVSVTADLKSLFNSAQATKTQACFSLTDGAGNQLSNPRTSSGVIVNTTTQCVSPDGAGHISTTVIANDQITPTNSIYTVTYMYNGRAVHGDIFQFALADGTENLNIKTSLSVVPVVAAPTGDTTYLRLDGGNNPLAFLTVTNNATIGGTFGVTGVTTLANVNMGAANTLSLSTIKQVSATTQFGLADNNGTMHFFIAGVAPFTNTFISGNGSGAVFLGQLAKANVADTTGTITTAGDLTLQNTSQLLPATIANDAAGGVTTTSNGGKSLQWNNSGVLIVNPAALSTGAALTVGGTSPSTGGMSIFVGASGAATEVAALYPADGSNASLRIQSLQIRTPSGGLLTGAQVFAISNTGSIGGASFATGIGQGSGFKHQRGAAGCATIASIGATCQTIVTWTAAFNDASYTVIGCMGNGVTSGLPVINAFGSKIAASISVQTVALTAAVAQFATIECTVVHD